ncbi:unnamed protein product [Angiostrongylus costaricensis]|uniref:Transcription factor n=1 Tax=Angiostrongylus costaricensis TaxID=334426 RepID=A0A0R3PE01_ANGCS|nr:unnamed protein product [Angiostrongylus costaricensis]
MKWNMALKGFTTEKKNNTHKPIEVGKVQFVKAYGGCPENCGCFEGNGDGDGDRDRDGIGHDDDDDDRNMVQKIEVLEWGLNSPEYPACSKRRRWIAYDSRQKYCFTAEIVERFSSGDDDRERSKGMFTLSAVALPS